MKPVLLAVLVMALSAACLSDVMIQSSERAPKDRFTIRNGVDAPARRDGRA